MRVSKLEWDIKPLFLAGIEATGTLYNFTLEGSLFCAVNDETGFIRDYDLDTSSTGEMTNYSRHSVKQGGSVFSDLNLSYAVELNERIQLIPATGIKYNKIVLTAEDGYLEYPPGSAAVMVYGKGIIYEQRYLIPYLGGGIKYFIKPFFLSVSFNYSHFLMCAARDSHVKRDTDFYDKIKESSYYNFNANLQFSLNNTSSLSVSSGFTYIPLAKGDSYYINLSDGGKSKTVQNGGGIKAVYGDLIVSIIMFF